MQNNVLKQKHCKGLCGWFDNYFLFALVKTADVKLVKF